MKINPSRECFMSSLGEHRQTLGLPVSSNQLLQDLAQLKRDVSHQGMSFLEQPGPDVKGVRTTKALPFQPEVRQLCCSMFAPDLLRGFMRLCWGLNCSLTSSSAPSCFFSIPVLHVGSITLKSLVPYPRKLFVFYWPVSVTNCHTLDGLKQYIFILLQFGRLDICHRTYWNKINLSDWVAFLSIGTRGGPSSLAFLKLPTFFGL